MTLYIVFFFLLFLFVSFIYINVLVFGQYCFSFKLI